jgi:hypothetical protein
MAPPRYLSSFLLKIGTLDPDAAQSLERRLAAMAGVAEAVLVPEEGVAYLKVDSRVVDYSALEELAVAGTAGGAGSDPARGRPVAEAAAHVLGDS